MEIEVGEYVRTKNGKIRKVKDTVAQYYITDRLNITDNNQFAKEDIVKHNKNIIDLIELGDILEIELSEEFVEKEDKKILTQIGAVYTKETLQKDIDNGIITKILTIITKEQYTQNCYKIDTN